MRSLFSSLLLAAGIPAAAHAQPAGSMFGFDLEGQGALAIYGDSWARLVARATQQNAPNMETIVTADDIREMSDVNAAEAVARTPGVSLETDTGEGRFVNIRGLDTNLNSTTFDGVHLPPTNPVSAQNGGRAVALDTIPAGMVGQSVVTYTNTPDQDADALGGTIDIKPRTLAPSGKPFVDAKIGSGVETLRGTTIQAGELTAGARFGAAGLAGLGSGITSYSDAPFTFIGTIHFNQDRRGVDDVDPNYAELPGALHNAYSGFDERYYNYHRKRLGFGGEFDFQPNADDKWYFRYYNFGYTESVNRQDLSTNLTGATPTLNPDGSITDTLASPAFNKGLRDETETLRTQLFMLGGENKLGPGTLDYHGAVTRGTYDKPYDFNSNFANNTASGTVTYIPGFNYPIVLSGPNQADPSGYTLASIENQTMNVQTDEWSGNINYTMPTHFTTAPDGQIKVGAGLRRMAFTSATHSFTYSPAAGMPLSQALVGGPDVFYNNMYNIGPAISADYMRGLYNSALANGLVATNPLGDAAAYSAINENIYSVYGQYQFGWGRLGVLAGVRAEFTQDTFDGNIVNGNTITPNHTAHSYANLFPSLQLRYDFTPTLIGRAIYSSTIARPGFTQSSAAVIVDPFNGIVMTGNPNLKPTTSQNFDLQLEKYLPHGGIVSLGLFDKSLSNYVVAQGQYVASSPYLIYNGPILLESFENVASARVRGLTANYEQRFSDWLPGAFGGLGTAFNWTWTNSHLDIRPGEDHTLPSAPRNTFNAALFYERGPLDMRLAWSYVGDSLWSVGNSAATDIYTASRLSLDFGGSYQATRNIGVYLDVKNILNTPLKFYEGSPDRPIQREFYGPTVMAGVRLTG